LKLGLDGAWIRSPLFSLVNEAILDPIHEDEGGYPIVSSAQSEPRQKK
jgi:hypothetical protein